jgi:hypothetical protein
MTRVAQLRLHGFQCTAVLVVLPVRPACGVVELLLQLRCDISLAVNLQQGALLGRAEPIFRALSRFTARSDIASD